jgi:hypothetical protein
MLVFGDVSTFHMITDSPLRQGSQAQDPRARKEMCIRAAGQVTC